MSELVSAFPTSGGIYWWASKLGGAEGRLLHRLAEPDRPAGDRRLGGLRLRDLLRPDARLLQLDSWAGDYSLNRVFIVLHRRLALAALINIFSSHLLAVLNNISVWWHVFGAAVVVADPGVRPQGRRDHASAKRGLHRHGQQHRLLRRQDQRRRASSSTCCRSSAILTQYTITGYDASAHLSEETKSAADSAAKGIWRSIFYSGIGGWILLLSFLFAVQNKDGVTKGGGVGADTIFNQALTPHSAGRSW